MARCNACGESFSLKNNRGIVDERNRLRPVVSEPCCPHVDCSQHGLGVSIGSPFCASFGKTTTGAPRWRCNACKKTFSSAVKSTSRQRTTHLNKLIFKELVNKAPIRRIAEICEVSPQTVYDKIDFIWKQCVAFAADRESKLSQIAIRRLYIGVDKQDYWLPRQKTSFPARGGTSIRPAVRFAVFCLLTEGQRFAGLPKHGMNRRYLARDANDLYRDLPDLVRDCSIKLDSGWWMSTNHSKQTIGQIIAMAAILWTASGTE